MENIEFEIPDLHCEGCAERSSNILERIDGVRRARVTFDDKSARVDYDGKKASFEQMRKALAKASYTAKPPQG